MEGGLRVKELLVVGGRGGSSLSLSLHGFLLPMSKEKPIQPQIGPGSAILNCPEGVQILFVDGTNGVKGKGSSLSPSPLWSPSREEDSSLTRSTFKKCFESRVWMSFVVVLEGVCSFSRTAKDSLYLPWGALSQE